MRHVLLAPGPVACALVALAALGCHSTSAEVVRSQASSDFSCPESKIQVDATKGKGTFDAKGCGKSGTYACEGWDNYNQAPICRAQ
jgi:hypothetical protein